MLVKTNYRETIADVWIRPLKEEETDERGKSIPQECAGWCCICNGGGLPSLSRAFANSRRASPDSRRIRPRGLDARPSLLLGSHDALSRRLASARQQTRDDGRSLEQAHRDLRRRRHGEEPRVRRRRSLSAKHRPKFWLLSFSKSRLRQNHPNPAKQMFRSGSRCRFLTTPAKARYQADGLPAFGRSGPGQSCCRRS